jgi:hypothetical protein
VPRPPDLRDVESPPREEAVGSVPSKEEVVEHAQSADDVVDAAASVDEVVGRDRSLRPRAPASATAALLDAAEVAVVEQR